MPGAHILQRQRSAARTRTALYFSRSLSVIQGANSQTRSDVLERLYDADVNVMRSTSRFSSRALRTGV
jgi:hypothetical protein